MPLGALGVSGVATGSRTLGVLAQLELLAAGAVLLALAMLLLGRELRRVRGRSRLAEDPEIRARAMMEELCPGGWQAQVTLYSATGLPSDAPVNAGGLVSVTWLELGADEDEDELSMVRRLWAPTISDGLAAMVEDRRADELPEHIEWLASTDDDPWEGSGA
ncbi:MAG: hypothetical protein ACRDLP_13080 [Solirubrobacteraceae bacterium]